MKHWIGLGVAIVLGLVGGAALAITQMQHRGMGNDIVIGPWSTARDIGTATTDVRTRAIVALRGLLALPPSEARYFNANSDSEGHRLSGKCSYSVAGGAIEARWWSLTLYNQGGWLIVNRWNKHSIGSAAIAPDREGNWRLSISPDAQSGAWIPTASDGPFELTLRAYRPRGRLASDPARVAMPIITRGKCRP